jgi:hypothetical protein
MCHDDPARLRGHGDDLPQRAAAAALEAVIAAFPFCNGPDQKRRRPSRLGSRAACGNAV